MTSLNELIAQQRAFDERHAGSLPFYSPIDEQNLPDLEHLLVCLIGEIGEFANILKKVRRGDFPLSSVKGELNEELSDVFIYLLKIAGQFNVDLEEEYHKKMNKNEVKFKRYEL
jgi:NTP pyrophosphatase (non-canonical NTP hydrolase)